MELISLYLLVAGWSECSASRYFLILVNLAWFKMSPFPQLNLWLNFWKIKGAGDGGDFSCCCIFVLVAQEFLKRLLKIRNHH